jgi:ABC-type oligopeptide transport system substrate-binding subunit
MGVKITFIKANSAQSFQEEEPKTHMIEMGWDGDYPDPDNFLHKSNMVVSLRRTGWIDARYEELIEQAAITPDRAQRLAMYRHADRILVNEEVLVYPTSYGGESYWANLVKPHVKHFRSNALGYIRFKEIVLLRDEDAEL